MLFSQIMATPDMSWFATELGPQGSCLGDFDVSCCVLANRNLPPYTHNICGSGRNCMMLPCPRCWGCGGCGPCITRIISIENGVKKRWHGIDHFLVVRAQHSNGLVDEPEQAKNYSISWFKQDRNIQLTENTLAFQNRARLGPSQKRQACC